MDVVSIGERLAESGPRSLQVTETHWGYIVRETLPWLNRGAALEASLRLIGLGAVIGAYGFWLVPGALLVGDVIAMKLVVSLLLAVSGAALYLYANKGFRPELQVDTARRELRFAYRNGRGMSRIGSRIAFGGIESIYVQRNQGEPGRARLYARVAGMPVGLHLIDGPEAALNRLHRRLCVDFVPPKERVEARLKAQSIRPRPVAVARYA